MNRRTFEEMVSYFNQTVADMDIDRKYKMELLGMITAILQRHDEDMKYAPTIERKKGKWKRAYLEHEAMGERPSILYCSICNQCIAYPTNYCPNCGSYNGG